MKYIRVVIISNILGHSIENFYKPNLLKRTRDWFFEQYVNFNNSLNSIFKP